MRIGKEVDSFGRCVEEMDRGKGMVASTKQFTNSHRHKKNMMVSRFDGPPERCRVSYDKRIIPGSRPRRGE